MFQRWRGQSWRTWSDRLIDALTGELAEIRAEGIAETFETVASNLSAADATFTYSGGDLVSIAYAGGITKTFTYGSDGVATITLSGSTPGGIDLVKTFTYSGGDLVGATYS